MTAQQGYAQLNWQSHLDPFHPGMIASQYPHSIKSAIFRAAASGDVLKFGTACGRHGGDTQRPQSANNFTGEAPTGGVRYAAGGGAYVTNTISYESFPAGAVHSNVTNSATTMVVGGTGHGDIVSGDYLQILDTSANDDLLEVVRVATVTSDTNGVSLTVSRGEFGTTASAFAATDKVRIFGRRNSFAGIALKDITIEGRWIEGETDSFIDLDEVPVGIKGDFAIVLDYASASAATTGGITPDAPVSVLLADDDGTGTNITTNGVYRPRAWDGTGTNPGVMNANLFSTANASSVNELVIKGARYVTGPYEATLWTRGTRGPGSGGQETVVIAAARFAGNV